MFIAVVLSILCISVSFGDGRIMVLVNRIPFLFYEEHKLISYSSKFRGNYRYADGDTVDISCINWDRNRIVKLNYIIENELFSYAMPKRGVGGIGLSTTLKRIHDHSIVSCEFYDDKKSATINTTLILQETFNDFIYLKVNQFTRRLEIFSIYKLFYLNNENLKLDCIVKNEDITYETVLLRKKEDIARITEGISTIKPNDYKYFRCQATSKSGHVLRAITTEFQQLLPELQDNTLLKLNVQEKRSLLTLYAFNGSQVIYYEYEEGDYFTLNCSTDFDIVPGGNYYLNFNGKEEKNRNYIIKSKRLSVDDNMKSIDCKLFYSYNEHTRSMIKRQIVVRLHMMTQYNTTYGPSKVFQFWILAAVGGVIIIVLVAICTVIYCRKYRHRRQKTENIYDGEEQVNEMYESIELCLSELKAQYSVPKRQTPNDAARNQGNQSHSDLNYAVLDIPHSGRVFKNPTNSEESPYAEVNLEANARPTVAHKSKKDNRKIFRK